LFKYFDYLSVKEVKIYCKFPNNDVGKVVLIDLPGLGDTNFADEEIIKILENNKIGFKIIKNPVDFIVKELLNNKINITRLDMLLQEAINKGEKVNKAPICPKKAPNRV